MPRLRYWLLASLAVAGCAPRRPAAPTAAPAPPASARVATSVTWESCDDGFAATGEPARDLERLARACGGALGLRPLAPARRHDQAASDPVDRYAFVSPGAGHCHRVFAVASREVEELDLIVRDPSGAVVARGKPRGAWVAAPTSSSLCLDVGGTYTVEVSVQKGQGSYAVQAWGN